MKLADVLDQIDSLDDDDVIFAKRPWTLDSEAAIGPLDTDMGTPKTMADRQLAYFLEATVAKEVLEVFGEKKPTPQEQRDLLIFYAERDAYPKWVYER